METLIYIVGAAAVVSLLRLRLCAL
jgi:hypothetical protein